MAQHDDKEAERLNREYTKYAALDEADIDSFIAGMLASAKGKKFLWWLLQIGKYGVNPFSPDVTTMAFQAGEMNVGSAILARVIDVNPLGFAELQLERKNENERRNESAKRIADGTDLFASGDDDANASNTLLYL
jgi:hypothetical protein